MRRNLTTLRAKSGGAQNGNGAGNPRQLIGASISREFLNFMQGGLFPHPSLGPGAPIWDPKYSGWSNATRPNDYAIFLRPWGTGDDR